MANNLYVIAAEGRSRKSVVVLGLMQLLLKQLSKVAFFRPIINKSKDRDTRDYNINLIKEHFGLVIPYEDTYVYTLDEAWELINRGQRTELLENIFDRFRRLEAEYDFILCEGTDFTGNDEAIEFGLNLDIAANLGCPVVFVANAAGKGVNEIMDSTGMTLDLMDEKGLDLVACLINRASISCGEQEEIKAALRRRAGQLVTGILPEDATLARPSTADVSRWLNGKVLCGGNRLDTLVADYLVAAMQVGNFLGYLTPGSLIITPGDREDIVLACLASRLSPSFPEISGIVLSGGMSPHSNILRLLNNLTDVSIPVILAEGHTFQTMQIITSHYGRIEPGDKRKINTAIGHFDRNVDGAEIAGRVVNRKSSKMTPRMFEYTLLEKAKQEKMRIVLPEGRDERILHAADALLRRGVAELIILGDPARMSLEARNLGLDLSAATLIDPLRSPLLDDYARSYHELRKHKGISPEQARDLILDPTYFGTMMVHKGDADGMVSGAVNTTAHTIRPAFEIIRARSAEATVSSVFFMCLKDRVLVFGDCAVIPNPTPQELANVAVNAAETAAVFGVTPRVAMLSYSTGSSGKGADVDKVKEATTLAKKLAPDLLLEGPMQYDAAIDATVASTKMPGNPVAGQATVFIFPDLNTGNNTYKAVQRAADAIAIGPVLQGLKKPVNDLSRGANVADIINTVAITAIQAQAVKKAATSANAPTK